MNRNDPSPESIPDRISGHDGWSQGQAPAGILMDNEGSPTRALARILRHDDKSPAGLSPVGAGFLIPRCRVITCAHVVTDALGLTGDTSQKPGARIILDFPLSKNNKPVHAWVQQWYPEAVMGNNPSYFKDCGDDCPVETVSWNDVQEFIKELNRVEGEERYRLPTEAEWEYACRAGSPTAFANGDITETGCDLDPNLDKIGWYCGNSEYKTHKVRKKEPNKLKLYDMHGNVWEWCQDWYGEYEVKGLRVKKNEMKDPNIYGVKDPTGPAKGSYRVVRGGGWGSGARSCRSADRNDDHPHYRNNDLGFRLVRSLP